MAFLANDPNMKDPLDESFFDMLKINMCPYLTFFSFTVIFSIIITVFFMIQLKVDGIDKKRLTMELLPIDVHGPFSKRFSHNVSELIEKMEVYRPFTAMFIHVNVYHLFSNALMLIIWTSYFESYLTSQRIPFMFFLSGINGNFFSAAIQGSKANSLGASTGIFGIMGSAVGFLIFNWRNLDYRNSPRNFFMCQLGLILLFSLLFTSNEDSVVAHLGGMLAGIFIGLSISARHVNPEGLSLELTNFEKINRVVGIFVSVTLLTVCVSILFIRL